MDGAGVRCGRGRAAPGGALGLAAYSLWGLFPLYFPLLEPAGGLEIVAHRVLWSLIFVGLLLTVRRHWSQVRALVADRRRLLVFTGAALLIAVNWLVFVYGVNSGQVVETSLGYFINPLVSVLLGVVVFSERLRALQWVAWASPPSRSPSSPSTTAARRGSPSHWRQLRALRGDEEAGAGGGGPGLFVETALVAIPAAAVLAVLHSGGHGRSATREWATPCCWPAAASPRRSRCCCSPRPPGGSRCRRSACCST